MPSRRRGLPGQYRNPPGETHADILLTLDSAFREALEIKEAQLIMLGRKVAQQLYNSHRTMYASIACSPSFLSIRELGLKAVSIVDEILGRLVRQGSYLSQLARKYLRLKASLVEAKVLLAV